MNKVLNLLRISKILAILSGLGLTLTVLPVFADQKSADQDSATATVFRCLNQGNGFATIAQRGSRTTSPLFTWNSTDFGPEYTPEKRCQLVSNRLTEVVAQNGGYLSKLYLTYGRVKEQTVICAVQGKDSGCNSTNTLFTLNSKNRQDPAAVLEQLIKFGVEGSGKPIEESNGRPFASLENWAESAFSESQTSESSTPSQPSQPPTPSQPSQPPTSAI